MVPMILTTDFTNLLNDSNQGISALLPPKLLARCHGPDLNDLGPGTPVKETFADLQELSNPSRFPAWHRSEMRKCCLAAFYFLTNHLEEGHRLVQDIGSSEGSYWHAIMHRREPDPFNSKYWFRQFGQHQIMQDLAKHAALIGYWEPSSRSWQPERFVDHAESFRGTRKPQEEILQKVQQLEWELLFIHCWQNG